MMTAAAANEHKSNIGLDFTLAAAYDAEYVDDEPAPEVSPKPRASDSRRDDDAAPLMGVKHTKVERCGAFVI